MVWDYRPGKTGRSCLHKNTAKSFNKLVPVRIIFENLLPFDAPGNDVMKSPWCIDSRFAWHAVTVSQEDRDHKKLII